MKRAALQSLRAAARTAARRLAPPLLKSARRLGLRFDRGLLAMVPQGALHPPQPGIGAPVITGWATPARGATAAPRVGLFWRGVLIAETVANRPRPEIAALGLAEKNCGFLIGYPDFVDLDTDPLILRRLDAGLTALASWPARRPMPAIAPASAPLDRLRPLLAHRIANAHRQSDPQSDLQSDLRSDLQSESEIDPVRAQTGPIGDPSPGRAPDLPLGPRHALLLAPDAQGRAAFTVHALRDRGDRVPDNAESALLAYLAGPFADRAAQGLVAPLAAADLARLRAMLPTDDQAGGADHLRRLAEWLAHGPGAAVPDIFAPDVFVPDVLGPDVFDLAVDAALAPLAAAATPGPWALSGFALWLLADQPAFAALLDPADPAHRRLWALALLAQAGGLPLAAALLPPHTRRAAQADWPAFCAGIGPAPFSGPLSGPLSGEPVRSAEGHRIAAPALRGMEGERMPQDPHGARPAPVDVQIIGPFSRASGLGQAARATAAALATTGLSLRLVDAAQGHPTPGGAAAGLTLARPGPARITLLHQNLEEIPATLAYGPDPAPGGTLIGFGFWELDRPPADHALGLRLIDRLWAASAFGKAIYTGDPMTPAGLPIDVAPLPVLLPACAPTRAAGRAHLDRCLGRTLGDTVVFFLSFDSYSFLARKNPQAAVDAFRAAFGPGRRDVALVLKTHNRAAIGDPAQAGPWRRLMADIAADPRITLIDATLPHADVLAMIAGADAYVSLHRAEGWGFGLIEAMALGVPLVATDWSGNRAFMDARDTDLIAARPVPVPQGAYLRVPPGAQWAEPDATAAAAALARIAADPAAARARAAAAQARILADFSPAAVGRGHLARLAPLLPDPGPAHPRQPQTLR